MIMTQEQAFLKAQEQLQTLIAFIQQAGAERPRVDQVERGWFAHLLDLGFSLLQAFVAAAGNGDEGESVPGPDGRVRRRLPECHQRLYRSIFGVPTIGRHVQGTREGQAIEWVPLDARLGLPEGEFSYLLEDWLQRFRIKGSFAEAAESLHALLGLQPSVRGLEHMNQTMAEFAGRYGDDRPPPPAPEEGELMVLTADGKGVIPRRPGMDQPADGPTPVPPCPQPVAAAQAKADGPGTGKTGKKKMAYVGAVHGIDRFVRAADDVLNELKRRARAKERPRPCHKHAWAEMTCVVEGETCSGRVTLFDHLAEEWDRREPLRAKTAICLLDGEPALWDARDQFFADTVGILDLFHVINRLWIAAHCFHPEKSDAAERFVDERLRMILEGKVGYVIGG